MRVYHSITNVQININVNHKNFSRSNDDGSQIDSIPSSSLSFEDQEKIVEELAKQPSKLFDVLMNPQKLSDSLSPSKQKSGIYIDPLLVRLP